MSETITIDGCTLRLSEADSFDFDWIGQEDVMHQLIAAWLKISEADMSMHPRLIGKPGVGKTTLAVAASKKLKRSYYIMQATSDTRPEDLIITPVLGENNRLQYVASPLVSAMITGGVCILDEGNRMSERSWASLASLLDRRRYVSSLIAGIKIHADDNFLFCTTMNEDASTFDIPEYIHSRLQPQIYLDFPDELEERKILEAQVPFSTEEIIRYVVRFLQRAHRQDERYSIRDGINISRYALKRVHQREIVKSNDKKNPLPPKNVLEEMLSKTSEKKLSHLHSIPFEINSEIEQVLQESIVSILGKDALKYT